HFNSHTLRTVESGDGYAHQISVEKLGYGRRFLHRGFITQIKRKMTPFENVLVGNTAVFGADERHWGYPQSSLRGTLAHLRGELTYFEQKPGSLCSGHPCPSPFAGLF